MLKLRLHLPEPDQNVGLILNDQGAPAGRWTRCDDRSTRRIEIVMDIAELAIHPGPECNFYLTKEDEVPNPDPLDLERQIRFFASDDETEHSPPPRLEPPDEAPMGISPIHWTRADLDLLKLGWADCAALPDASPPKGILRPAAAPTYTNFRPAAERQFTILTELYASLDTKQPDMPPAAAAKPPDAPAKPEATDQPQSWRDRPSLFR